MKELLAKIRQAVGQKEAQSKCALIAHVYEHMNAGLEKITSDLDNAGMDADFRMLDGQLDELEAIANELVEILNPELQKVLKFLKPRFEAHMYRHKDIAWEQVEMRLREADTKKIWSLSEMERTGGEPDVTGIDKKTGELIFQDRSPESPTGRRNCVYDKDGEKQLKRDYPNETCNGNAVDMAAAIGVELLDEERYREAQKVDKLDQNSWSWLKTPIDKRREGVALVGHRFGDDVDVYEYDPHFHGVDRGFRASLRV